MNRTITTSGRIALDYKISLYGLQSGSEEYQTVLRECHARTGCLLRELCFANGGIYVKAGQFVGNAQGMPREIHAEMRTLCDQAVETPIDEVGWI